MSLIADPDFKAVHKALHKLWTEAAHGALGEYTKEDWRQLDMAINHLASRASKKPTWQDIKTCDVCYEKKALTFSKDSGVKVSVRVDEFVWRSAGVLVRPTHWMPLPDPPENLGYLCNICGVFVDPDSEGYLPLRVGIDPAAGSGIEGTVEPMHLNVHRACWLLLTTEGGRRDISISCNRKEESDD